MKKLKFLSIIMIISILVCVFSPAFAIALDDPGIQANAVVLVEVNTGEVFYAKNETARIYPASTTKIMTLLLAVEAYERGEVQLDDMITASENIRFDVSWDASNLDIQPGETMRFEDLLYCAIVASACEACNIIAEHISGSVGAFLEIMNKRAAELGCTGTSFKNVHGLPNDDHYTTAWDTYLMAKEAISHPLFMEIANTTSKEIAATNMSDIRYISTTNNLISTEKTSKYYYQHARGIKTGTTNAAGFCLVSSAELDGIHVVSVVMGAQSVALEDGTTEVQSFTETRRLFEWGFASFSYQDVLTEAELIAEVPVILGDGADFVIAKPSSSISVLLPNDISLDAFERSIEIFSQEDDEPLMAPVSSGQILGRITLSYNGKTYGPVSLVAATSVELSRPQYIMYRIQETLDKTWVKVVIITVILLFVGYIIFVIRYNRARKKRRMVSGYTGRGKKR